MPKPTFTSGFETPDEGTYLFQVQTCEFKTVEGKDGKPGGLQAEVKSKTVESFNSHSIDVQVQDYFALYTEFGLSRFLGLAVKAVGLPVNDYPMNYFDDVKKQQKMMASMPGVMFGGEIKHSKGKKEGSVFANIKEYFSKAEYREKAKAHKGTPKETAASAPVGAEAGTAGAPAGEEEW